jgi:serine/threonine protein kinase
MISKSNNFSINNRFDDKIPKIVDNQTYLQAILWNLGVLMHELYFGKLPSNILEKFENKEFDDLIVKLLEKNEEKRIRWKDYLRHNFFLTLEPEKVFKIILDKNIEKSCQEIDLHKNEIDNYNFEILMKIDFANLIVLNLTDNYIENLEISNNNLNIFKI